MRMFNTQFLQSLAFLLVSGHFAVASAQGPLFGAEGIAPQELKLFEKNADFTASTDTAMPKTVSKVAIPAEIGLYPCWVSGCALGGQPNKDSVR